jgi:capsular exopolysaccharide synthesis family protein
VNDSSQVQTAGFAPMFDLRETRPTAERTSAGAAAAKGADRRLVNHPDADAVFVEQYRRLGAALHHAQVHNGVRGIMVASAVAAEGKTLSATNLALMLSRFRKRVLLVDGDLRKPSVHGLLAIANTRGLTDVLKGAGDPLPAHELSPALSVLTAGSHDPDPVSLLVSESASRFLTHARQQFDWVIVDTPPVVLFPDAGLFAERLDACVLVVSAATTAAPVASTAIAALGPSRILGVVLNRAEPADIAAGYDYGRYRFAGAPTWGRRTWWRGGAR